MSIDGRWRPHPPSPRTSHPAALALLAPCGDCWAEPGTTCADDGQHYARYVRIYRRDILDAAGMAAISNAAPQINAGTIVPEAVQWASAPPRAPL